jgi:hypothetical protein
VLAAEGLEVGGGVDVGDRGDQRVRGFEHLGQLAPAALDLGQVGHVGHRTAGGEVGQDGLLVGLGHDVRHLGHEMHAAEHDELGVGLGGEARQLERVAGEVGVLVDVGALVVVAQQHGLVAEAARAARMRSWASPSERALKRSKLMGTACIWESCGVQPWIHGRPAWRQPRPCCGAAGVLVAFEAFQDVVGIGEARAGGQGGRGVGTAPLRHRNITSASGST